MMKDNKLTLLVVDDEIINITVLLEVLGKDYNVRVATDSSSALDSVDEIPPDLILMDVTMPGMDGFEVCRRLKKDPNTWDIPVIFLTARDDDAAEALGLDLGAVDYITKPFNPALVKKRVQNNLELNALLNYLAVIEGERTHGAEAIANLTDFIRKAEDRTDA